MIHRLLLAAVALANLGASYPDFLQTDPSAGLAKSGTQYCAPCAVSNSLIFLSEHGHPALRPRAATVAQSQVALIHILGGPAFMATNPTNGTGAGEVIRGLRRYLRGTGCHIQSLTYEGWRRVPETASSGELPSLETLRRVLSTPSSAAWLNVGWYTRKGPGLYHRESGHWLTVVGLEGSTLLVNDPSPRAGPGPSTERLTLARLSTGTLTGSRKGLPRPASGLYEMHTATRKPAGIDAGILDGVVYLELGCAHADRRGGPSVRP
jgi:hypothetical protein